MAVNKCKIVSINIDKTVLALVDLEAAIAEKSRSQWISETLFKAIQDRKNGFKDTSGGKNE